MFAKLLSLASLQGIADILTGEGLRFTDFEMRFSNKKGLMTIEEMYAIGPAVSILMEGYIEKAQINNKIEDPLIVEPKTVFGDSLLLAQIKNETDQ